MVQTRNIFTGVLLWTFFLRGATFWEQETVKRIAIWLKSTFPTRWSTNVCKMFRNAMKNTQNGLNIVLAHTVNNRHDNKITFSEYYKDVPLSMVYFSIIISLYWNSYKSHHLYTGTHFHLVEYMRQYIGSALVQITAGRRQAIIWTNVGILLIGPLVINFSDISIEINDFSFKKCIWKWRLWNGGHFCPGGDEFSCFVDRV